MRTKLTSSTAWVEPDANLPGTHRPEGVVALAGVGLPPGRNLKAHLIDATPTILALLGLPIPGHIEGTPIAGSPHTGGRLRETSPSSGMTRPNQPLTAHIDARSNTPPKSKRSSSSDLMDLGYLE